MNIVLKARTATAKVLKRATCFSIEKFSMFKKTKISDTVALGVWD